MTERSERERKSNEPGSGGPAHVNFDARWVIKREEEHGDIAGIFHTHPPGITAMSARDRRTMEAWSMSFGRPLLCAIRCGRRTRAWLCDRAGGTREVASVKIAGRTIAWTP